jgi:hypothetical protein
MGPSFEIQFHGLGSWRPGRSHFSDNLFSQVDPYGNFQHFWQTNDSIDTQKGY